MAENLTPKQEQFVAEYLVDLNAKQAAIRAGYSPKTAEAQASRLLRNVKVADELTRRRAAISDKLEITQEWVIKKLVDNVERAMQAEPVRDHEGNETGQYNYAGSVANGALTLLGKHLGMFIERQISDNTHRIIVEYTDESDGDDHTD
jgi:phage terminase small subunit